MARPRSPPPAVVIARALAASVSLAGCMHRDAGAGPEELPPRDVHAHWWIETLPAPPLAIDWHDPLRVSLVVDGQVIEGARASTCALGGTWQGAPAPQSMVQCSVVGGVVQVGAFRDGDAVIVRRQGWELVDANQGPPAVHGEETGRIILAPGGRLRFDPPPR